MRSLTRVSVAASLTLLTACPGPTQRIAAGIQAPLDAMHANLVNASYDDDGIRAAYGLQLGKSGKFPFVVGEVDALRTLKVGEAEERNPQKRHAMQQARIREAFVGLVCAPERQSQRLIGRTDREVAAAMTGIVALLAPIDADKQTIGSLLSTLTAGPKPDPKSASTSSPPPKPMWQALLERTAHCQDQVAKDLALVNESDLVLKKPAPSAEITSFGFADPVELVGKVYRAAVDAIKFMLVKTREYQRRQYANELIVDKDGALAKSVGALLGECVYSFDVRIGDAGLGKRLEHFDTACDGAKEQGVLRPAVLNDIINTRRARALATPWVMFQARAARPDRAGLRDLSDITARLAPYDHLLPAISEAGNGQDTFAAAENSIKRLRHAFWNLRRVASDQLTGAEGDQQLAETIAELFAGLKQIAGDITGVQDAVSKLRAAAQAK